MALNSNQIDRLIQASYIDRSVYSGKTNRYFYDLFKGTEAEGILELINKYNEINHIDIIPDIKDEISDIIGRYNNIRVDLVRIDELDTSKSRLDLLTRFRSLSKETSDKFYKISRKIDDMFIINDDDNEYDSNDEYDDEYDDESKYLVEIFNSYNESNTSNFVHSIIKPKIRHDIFITNTLYGQLTEYIREMQYEYYTNSQIAENIIRNI